MKRNIMNLDGIWDFSFAENLSLKEADPSKVNFDQINPVPGCFDTKAPYYALRGTAFYKRSVFCGGKVKLDIQALGLEGKVFWDGQLLGICEHAFSPEIFYFDAGERKEHTLVIAVENIPHSREEGRMYVADYDFHCYGGIYDSVSLHELPQFYFERVQITPLDLSGRVRIKLVCGGALPPQYRIRYSFDKGSCREKLLSGSVNEWVDTVEDKTPWSPESPVLHHFCAVMDGEDGVVCDRLETTFGIRTIEARDNELFLNGKKLLLIGYNRHDSHPDFGYALPVKLMYEDLSMIKNQGCNFIRTSHYPQRQKFLDLCDRMGLLVWEEILGWNNQPEHCAHPDFIRLECEQAVTMVHKSANHPCVIMWGFLNEVYMPEGQSPRPLLEKLVTILRNEDPSRPITFAFATGWIDKSDTCLDLVDIISFNTYPGWYSDFDRPWALDRVRTVLQKFAVRASEDPDMKGKPLIISEIGCPALLNDHSTMRWSEEYQEGLMEEVLKEIFANKRYSGLAIWQFCDTRTYLVTNGFLTRPRGFNNKGLVNEYRIPKLAWRAVTRFLQSKGFDGYKK